MEPTTWGERAETKRRGGFTLIELLMVVAILGLLAAIALPTFGSYRRDAYDARAIHDLRNAVAAQEAYYAANLTYVTVTATGPAYLPVPGLVVSETVTLELKGSSSSFSGKATSSKGTGKVFEYDSLTDAFING